MVGARRAAVAVCIGWLGSGCGSRCGEYEHQTGLLWDIDPSDSTPPESIDGYRLHEICGAKMGSIGYRDPDGDGIASMRLDGTHPNSHVAITLTSGIFLEFYFQSAALEVGRTLSVDDLTNQGSVFETGAYVLDLGGNVHAPASLTDAEIEFLDVKPNEFWSADAYRVRFDVTFGEPGTSEFWYTAKGEDWIAML
jgi:hypothetical protein